MNVSTEMRKEMVTFVYGGEPWNSQKTYPFGPASNCAVIEDGELAKRHRIGCING